MSSSAGAAEEKAKAAVSPASGNGVAAGARCSAGDHAAEYLVRISLP